MADVELITDKTNGIDTTADKQNTDITKDPSPIPDNWKEWIPQDIRDTPVIKETKDITAMAKRLVDSQSMLGKSIKMPADGDTTGFDELYNKLGRPEKIDGYKITRPDMPEGMIYDENLEKSFLEVAHKVGLNSSQVNAAIAWNQSQVLAQAQTQAEAAKDAVSQLKHDWGNAFDERLEITERVVDQFGEGETSADSIKDNPALIKLIYNMGKDLLESQAGGKGGLGTLTMSPKEALAKINELNRDKEFMDAYTQRKNSGHQGAVDEMNSLYKMAYPEEG